jgi:16S rRNA (adenine1518-N6/adenine1519-N6)-dimethyltransferase
MRQNLGQHFLKNFAAIKKIVSALNPEKETIIEIGSGRGALTKPLAEVCEKTACKILAIEKDPTLAEEARGWGLKNLEVIEGDALTSLENIVADIRGKYKIVGNIPYYMTGFLLRKLGKLEPKPELIVLTVQKEVAERLVAEPPKMNRLAASVRFWAEPKIIAILPWTYFSPPPKVDSAIISLSPTKKYEEIAPNVYYKIMRALFAQPRKTILNNLRAGGEKSAENLSAELTKLGLDPKVRPQNLRVEDVVAVAKVIGP